MRIVLLSSDYLPRIGGVSAHVHELARAYKAKGIDVTVATIAASSLARPRTWWARRRVEDEIPVIDFSSACLPGGRGLCARLRTYGKWLCAQARRDKKCLILHSHEYEFAGHHLAEHCTDAIRIFTNHTSMFLQDYERFGGATQWKKWLACYHGVIAPSEELAEATRAISPSWRRVENIPNGVDCERFKPNLCTRMEVRRELGFTDDEVVLICARRIVPKNGVIDFAHSLRCLRNSNNPVRVVFAGNQDDGDSYEQEVFGAVVRSGFEQRAVYLGAVPNTQMSRLYCAADISVLPSLKEATSIAGLEAMACGVPIVGTNIGGIPEIVHEQKTGLLVDAGDPMAFGHALRVLIEDHQLRHAFSINARELAVSEFSWSRIADRTILAYKSAEQSKSLMHSVQCAT